MTIRIDASLGSAARAPEPGSLGTSEPPVVLVGPARTAPFLLEGTRVAVVGDERRGDHGIWIDGRLVLAGLTTDGGTGVNVVSAPASIRRELLGSTSVMEHTLALPTLPMVAIQWAPPSGGRSAGGLVVTFTLLPTEESVRYLTSDGGIRVSPGEGEAWTVEVQAHPPPASWSVGEDPQGGVTVQATLVGPGPLTLLVAGGPDRSADRALPAAAHLAAHETLAAAESDPQRTPGLAVVTGVHDVDHALVWAAGRVRNALRRGTSGPADETFWAGLAALAMGDDESARSAMATLQRPHQAAVEWPLDGTLHPGALSTLLAARYTLATGDAAPARDAHAALVGEGVLRSDYTVRPEAWGGWALALATLADALRHAAPEEDIQRLRDVAARPAPRVAVRLPMVGATPTSQPVALHHLLGRVSPPPALLPVAEAYPPLASWALWAAGDADAAWVDWRRVVGSGMVDPDRGRGCWDQVLSPPRGAPGAALVLCALAHGLLGLSPDAPSGRLGISPILPAHVTAFEVRDIRVGDARLTMRYRRNGATHRFVLEPTRGGVPPMIVFEPSVPCGTVASARVDGATADVEIQPLAGRSMVRVQLPLDGMRTLEVDEGVQ